MTFTKRTLKAELRKISDLTVSQKNSMWEVFCRYYDNASREAFERDLEQKTEVILLKDVKEGSIQGFSTLHFSKRIHEGKRVAVVFSGDTVIEKRYWGQSALQWRFFFYVIRKKLTHPFHRTYWFLISKGYKTYLLLTRNFVEYWPRYEEPTPPWQLSLIDTLSRERFSGAWVPERGVIDFKGTKDILRESIAPIREELLKVPDIRFFVEKNPGHGKGDELCCLGRVDSRMAQVYPRKIIKRLLRKN